MLFTFRQRFLRVFTVSNINVRSFVIQDRSLLVADSSGIDRYPYGGPVSTTKLGLKIINIPALRKKRLKPLSILRMHIHLTSDIGNIRDHLCRRSKPEHTSKGWVNAQIPPVRGCLIYPLKRVLKDRTIFFFTLTQCLLCPLARRNILKHPQLT